MRILITGSVGLIGSALDGALVEHCADVVHLDLRAPANSGRGDVRDPARVCAAMASCDGIVHLAAVSRVIWGELDPHLCWSTNVRGTRAVLSAALASSRSPWVIFASSREVYGQPARLPVTEDDLLSPVNVYGRVKVAGERLVNEACRAGLRAAIVRLSNVYGSTTDHVDRVVPAFARAAAAGGTLRVEGRANTFDFTHLRDVVDGLTRLVDLLHAGGVCPPPIHLLTGEPTTLGELAALAVRLGGRRARIAEAPARDFDVARFYGNPERARKLLGWMPRVSLRRGLARLIHDFRAELSPSGREAGAP